MPSLTPVIIEGRNDSIGQPLFGQWQGPYEFNGAIYVILVHITLGMSGSAFLSMYKSVNNGNTWVEQDESNRPEMSSVFSSVHLEDNTLYCIYTRILDGSLSLINFDFSTDSWASPVHGGPTPISGNLLFTRFSNGDFFLAYPAIGGLKYAIYNGAWSAPAALSTGAGGQIEIIESILIDALDRVYVIVELFWNNANIGDTNTVVCVTYRAGVLNAPQICYTGFTGVNNTKRTTVDYGKINGSSVTFPILGRGVEVNPNFRTIQVIRGTLADLPVFTLDVVFTDVSVDVNSAVSSNPVWAMTSGTREIMFWCYNNTFTHTYVYAEKLAGVWNSPTVYYDLDANPPQPPPFIDIVEYGSATLFQSGGLGSTIGLFSATGAFCDIQYYLALLVTSGWKVYEI